MPEPVVPERVILASASPRRSALLAQIGVPHRVVPAHVAERREHGESIAACVLRLAEHKALHVSGQMADCALPVLGADTVVVIDDCLLGKPRDREDALAMLARLSGREHEVLSAVALVQRGRVESRLCRSTVRFRPLSAAQRAAYWDSGEPQDKAGGYAIQGLGAVFVESLHGSYSGVMGLPLFETAALLQGAGVSIVA